MAFNNTFELGADSERSPGPPAGGADAPCAAGGAR